MAELLAEDHTAVSAAATAAVLANTMRLEDGDSPSWRPSDEYASKALFDIISPRSASSGP